LSALFTLPPLVTSLQHIKHHTHRILVHPLGCASCDSCCQQLSREQTGIPRADSDPALSTSLSQVPSVPSSCPAHQPEAPPLGRAQERMHLLPDHAVQKLLRACGTSRASSLALKYIEEAEIVMLQVSTQEHKDKAQRCPSDAPSVERAQQSCA